MVISDCTGHIQENLVCSPLGNFIVTSIVEDSVKFFTVTGTSKVSVSKNRVFGVESTIIENLQLLKLLALTLDEMLRLGAISHSFRFFVYAIYGSK